MITPLLARNVAGSWGEAGRRWLGDLPALAGRITARWDLTIAAPCPMTFHWVARVRTARGGSAVLKLGVPDGHLAAEAEALRLFDGDGAVRLLAEDPSAAALLIDHADPGTPLASRTPAADAEATAALIEVGRRLHRVPPPSCALPHLRTHRESFARHPAGGPIPRRMVQRAAELFDDLVDGAPRETVLHGDLHHDNVLWSASDGWRAIDPRGLVGDPGFDGAAMLYNPDPHRRDPDLLRLVPGRLEQLADHADADRVVAWGFVMAVLSEVWSVGADPGAVTRALDVARMLEPRLT